MDIPEQTDEVGISIIKFIRMSSIILDNAIEEAEQSPLRELQLSFFIHNHVLKLIVVNSCIQETIDIPEIYHLGVSNKKGKERGVGLYTLNH